MKNWFKVFLLFFVLGLLVYFNSLNNKFILDDFHFLDNPALSDTKFILSQWDPYQEQARGVVDPHDFLNDYRPMTFMLYDLCYPAFKNNYWQYHLLNLFLFVLASSLIYLFIERITGNFNLALLTGLFYLVHPLNGIMVNYISAGVFAFQVIFMLGTLLLLIGSLERKNNRRLYLLSLLFSFLSLFWHESAVMIPFYVSAYVLLFNKGSSKQKAFCLFPYFLIVFIYFVFRAIFFSGDGGILGQISHLHLTLREYLASLFQIFAWYLSKLFYPQGIVMQWAIPFARSYIFLKMMGLFLFLIISLVVFVSFSKNKILQLSLIWVLLGFAPVCLACVLRVNNGFKIEPHWFVFSSIGLFILTVYFCLMMLARSRILGFGLLFVLIFIWGSISHANNLLWADQKTYNLYWLQQDPGFKLPIFDLGNAYMKEGSYKEAEKYYKMSLSGDARDEDVYNNIGIIDEHQGDIKGAVLNYKRAIDINPRSSRAFNNLGSLYEEQGQWEKASALFHQALTYNPLMLEPRRGLATISFKHADYKKAISLCLLNFNIVKDDPETFKLLMDILIREKDIISLKEYAPRFINAEDDPKDMIILGGIMGRQNDFGLALDCYEKALRVAPDYKETYLELGMLLANFGKYDQAIHIWKMGSSIDPSDDRFRKDIERVHGIL